MFFFCMYLQTEEQVRCHLTYMTEEASQVITDNMHLNRHVMEETKGPR